MAEDSNVAVEFLGLRYKQTWREEMFQQAMKLTVMLFHENNFFEDQATALSSFFGQQNIYFSAPTGYRKSIIYQALPIVADHYNNGLIARGLFLSIQNVSNKAVAFQRSESDSERIHESLPLYLG